MKPRFREEDEMEFNPDDFDTTPASKFDFEDEFEPAEKEELMPGSGDEAELKMLQAKLRELPKGHPMKKDLAVRILDLHKKLSSEDTGYADRRARAAEKTRKAALKKQQWMDSILSDDEDGAPFENRRVLRCSDFIILEKKRAEVLKDADKKYPNLSKGKMKDMLKDQEKGAKDFDKKAKKYFGWAKDPAAAAAAFIRKATGKEPSELKESSLPPMTDQELLMAACKNWSYMSEPAKKKFLDWSKAKTGTAYPYDPNVACELPDAKKSVRGEADREVLKALIDLSFL